MDAGQRWALEVFGPYGRQIRERIPALVQAEHWAMVDAQEASGHRSRGVYGQAWRGLIEKFEEFGRIPGGSLVSPGRAPYKIPVINGVALFPWRYGDGAAGPAAEVAFATSDARVALFNLPPTPVQPELDLELPAPSLSDDEREVIAEFISEDGYTRRVVVVAVACSMAGIQDVRWGEARLGLDGFLEFVDQEVLLRPGVARPVALTDESLTFEAGEPPRKHLRLQGEAAGEVGDA